MCVDRQAGDDRGLDDKTHFDDDGENTSYIAFIMLVQYFLVFNLYKYILYNVYHSTIFLIPRQNERNKDPCFSFI